jgi:hypothetical protein
LFSFIFAFTSAAPGSYMNFSTKQCSKQKTVNHSLNYVRIEVFTAVTMKNAVFLDV